MPSVAARLVATSPFHAPCATTLGHSDFDRWVSTPTNKVNPAIQHEALIDQQGRPDHERPRRALIEQAQQAELGGSGEDCSGRRDAEPVGHPALGDCDAVDQAERQCGQAEGNRRSCAATECSIVPGVDHSSRRPRWAIGTCSTIERSTIVVRTLTTESIGLISRSRTEFSSRVSATRIFNR